MREGLVFLLCALAGTTVLAQTHLSMRTLLEGRVSMLVPSSFMNMPPELKRQKYPGANAPGTVLSNGRGTVNIALDLKQLPLALEQVPELEQPVVAQMRAQPGTEILKSGVRGLNGHKFLVVEMRNRVADGVIYNTIAMTSLEQRMLVISYNCLLAEDAGCGEVGAQIIDSIKLPPRGDVQIMGN